MAEEITMDVIMKMGCNARQEALEFEKDTFDNLLKKYKDIRDKNEYIDASLRRILNEQIELAIKQIASISSKVELLKLMGEIIDTPRPT